MAKRVNPIHFSNLEVYMPSCLKQRFPIFFKVWSVNFKVCLQSHKNGTWTWSQQFFFEELTLGFYRCIQMCIVSVFIIVLFICSSKKRKISSNYKTWIQWIMADWCDGMPCNDDIEKEWQRKKFMIYSLIKQQVMKFCRQWSIHLRTTSPFWVFTIWRHRKITLREGAERWKRLRN